MTNEIIVKTQKELDAIKTDFTGTIYIEGGERFDPLILKIAFDQARVIIRGSAYAELRGSSHAVLRESSHAELWGSSHAVLRGSSHAVLRESSHAELWESSHAELWESSHAELWESSHAELRGSSHAELWESSHAVLRGSSHAVLRGSSHAELWESSHAELWESSHAELWESSHADLYGEAMVSAKNAKEIVCHGYNVISLTKSVKDSITIVMNKDSYLKVVPDFAPTFKDYAKRYPVTTKGTKAILYKAVHKREGKYYSDYNSSFEYEIGKTYKETPDPQSAGSCARGLHIAHKSWAHAFGYSWPDLAILECEISIKNIIVAQDCDGKVRTGKLKVLREVDIHERG
jgi:hypothetical protein